MGWPYGVTVTWLVEQVDRYGDVTLVEVGQSTGCAVAPRTRTADTEDNNRSARVAAGMVLWCSPSSVALTAQHRVRFDLVPDDVMALTGTVWEVRGQPYDWRSPLTGWHPGLQVELERVTG